jgi:hypothetical protein
MSLGGVLASLAGGAGRGVERQARDRIDEARRIAKEKRDQALWAERYGIQRTDQVADIENHQEFQSGESEKGRTHSTDQLEIKLAHDAGEGVLNRTHDSVVLGSKQGFTAHQNQLDRDLKAAALAGELTAQQQKTLANKVHEFDSWLADSFDKIDKINADPDIRGEDKPQLLKPIYLRIHEYTLSNPHISKYSNLYPTVEGEIDAFFKPYAPKEQSDPAPEGNGGSKFKEPGRRGGGSQANASPTSVPVSSRNVPDLYQTVSGSNSGEGFSLDGMRGDGRVNVYQAGY